MPDLSQTPIAILDISHVAGYLYVVAGIMLTVSLLWAVLAIVYYFSRLGLASRDEAIHDGETATTILFALVIILGIAKYVQQYADYLYSLLITLIIIFIVWQFAKIFSSEEEKPKASSESKPAKH